MALTVTANGLKSSLKIIIDGEPCIILENEYVKPGKGQAFNRVKFRRLLSGRVLEKTFKSGDTFEVADIREVTLDYIYNDSQFYHFIHNETFDQISADSKVVGGSAKWLVANSTCTLTLWNGNPIVVTPPKFVELEIAETDPGLRGDTQSSGGKPATLVTGAVVRVPLFVQVGELIRIDTRSEEYVSRVK